MIDLHTHLLYETDDGTETIEETINQLKQAEKAGMKKICFTPHYIEPDYINSVEENKKKLEKIKELAKENNINVELYLGNEIYITDNIIEDLKENKISTIAGSSYILLELPMHHEVRNLSDILERLISWDYKIIIAHPERYSYVQENINYFYNLIEGPLYLQGNYESIVGKYGKDAQKTIIKLLKSEQIAILSTDIHRKDFYNDLEEILKKVKKITTEEYCQSIIMKNQEKIIKDEDIELELKKIKKIFNF